MSLSFRRPMKFYKKLPNSATESVSLQGNEIPTSTQETLNSIWLPLESWLQNMGYRLQTQLAELRTMAWLCWEKNVKASPIVSCSNLSNLSIQNSNYKKSNFPSSFPLPSHYIGLYMKYTQYIPPLQNTFKS